MEAGLAERNPSHCREAETSLRRRCSTRVPDVPATDRRGRAAEQWLWIRRLASRPGTLLRIRGRVRSRRQERQIRRGAAATGGGRGRRWYREVLLCSRLAPAYGKVNFPTLSQKTRQGWGTRVTSF